MEARADTHHGAWLHVDTRKIKNHALKNALLNTIVLSFTKSDTRNLSLKNG